MTDHTTAREGYPSTGWTPSLSTYYDDRMGVEWAHNGDVWDAPGHNYGNRHLSPEYEPYAPSVDPFDRDLLYFDADGEEWEFYDGAWVWGESSLVRRVNRREGLGDVVPPAEYGPYTRAGHRE